MKNDYLAVSPNADALRELTELFRAAPFDVREHDSWHLPIIVSDRALPESVVMPGAVYTAYPLGTEVWYDENLGKSSLVIVFASDSIRARHNQVKLDYSVESEHTEYVPFMSVVRDLPPSTKSARAFCSSLDMTFNRERLYLTFTDEVLLDSGGYTPYRHGVEYSVGRDIHS